MERIFTIAGALSACLAVGFGAFGAHGLKSKLSDAHMAAYQTGVLYHLIHALALFAVAWAFTQWPSRWTSSAGWLFVAGTLLFSGSLYALAISGISRLGMITPLGGLMMMAGWVCLALGAYR